MGIFSTNRYGSVGSNVVIEAAEGYHGEIGAAIAMLEGYQNDMALFNGIIATDFQEACLIQEGASAEEVYILQEGALKGAWEKLKEFFKKLGEKIKGIFHAFIAKMESVFMKDSKKFYDKYAQEIRLKDIKDLYVPCRDLKEGITENNIVPKFKNYDFIIFAEKDKAINKLSEFDEDKEFSGAVALYIDGLTNNVTKSTFKEDFYNYTFKEKNDVKFTSKEIVDGWPGALLSKKDGLKTIKDSNEKIGSLIKKYIDFIDKLEKETDTVLKAGKTGEIKNVEAIIGDEKKGTVSDFDDVTKKTNVDTSKDAGITETKKWQAVYQLAQRQTKTMQEVFNMYAGLSVEVYKEACTTARKIFAAAVAYSPKKENAELAIAVGDSAYYEACDLIDNMYYVAD